MWQSVTAVVWPVAVGEALVETETDVTEVLDGIAVANEPVGVPILVSWPSGR